MRVSLDDSVYNDPRVALAAAELDMNVYEFVGRICLVWAAAYVRRSALMQPKHVDALSRHIGFADSMVSSDLAVPQEQMLYLRGVTERIEFLLIQDHKRELASKAKRAKAGLPPERPPGPPPASPRGRPYTITTASAPTLDLPTTGTKALAGEDHVAPDGARDVPFDALRLAGLLHDLIAKREPDGKIAKRTPEAREGDVARWAIDIDKLHRLDKVAVTDIERAIRYSQESDFWAPNILSGKKVREKFETLLGQSKRKTNGVNVGRVEPHAAADYAKDAEDEF
jgi:hypothetical protein